MKILLGLFFILLSSTAFCLDDGLGEQLPPNITYDDLNKAYTMTLVTNSSEKAFEYFDHICEELAGSFENIIRMRNVPGLKADVIVQYQGVCWKN